MTRRAKKDAFEKNKIVGEYAKPGPRTDPEGQAIADGLSKLSNRAKTGFVVSWLPIWAKRAKLPAFGFYFFEDALAVDFFNRNREEMDALEDDFTPAQRQEISHKTVLCGEHGVKYLFLGPDDELDITQLAARIGKTTFKKGGKQVSRSGAAPARHGGDEDGISEEDA